MTTHDADLCKQIKALEKRVGELERELRTHGPHSYPYYPYTPFYYPRIWYGTGGHTVGNTTYTIDNTTSGSITVG